MDELAQNALLANLGKTISQDSLNQTESKEQNDDSHLNISNQTNTDKPRKPSR